MNETEPKLLQLFRSLDVRTNMRLVLCSVILLWISIVGYLLLSAEPRDFRTTLILLGLIYSLAVCFWLSEKSGVKYVKFRRNEQTATILVSHTTDGEQLNRLLRSAFPRELETENIIGFSEGECRYDSGLLFPATDQFSKYALDSFTGAVYDVVTREDECKNFNSKFTRMITCLITRAWWDELIGIWEVYITTTARSYIF